MYAIVRVGGLQFKATPNSIIRVPLLDEEVGKSVTFDQVLMWSDDTSTTVGSPLVNGKSVTAEVVRHSRSEKLRIFKKRRRKKFRRRGNHRQWFTEVRIAGF
ncbi:MAG TPA: 50S ribosomal protein L21 [Candidatus Krumholzibacteria bacterium]|nr:50S ribosomal protein L21 [Candidatus Krumholzibacteria bacterium]